MYSVYILRTCSHLYLILLFLFFFTSSFCVPFLPFSLAFSLLLFLYSPSLLSPFFFLFPFLFLPPPFSPPPHFLLSSLPPSLPPSLPLSLPPSLPPFNIRLPQIILVLLQDGPRQDWKLSPTLLPSLMMRQTANQSLREETTVRYFSFTYFSLIPNLVKKSEGAPGIHFVHVWLPRFFWGTWKLP